MDTEVLPAAWPNTVSVAPELLVFESVTVATAVLADSARIDPLAALMRAVT
jgi:hypothetical protein